MFPSLLVCVQVPALKRLRLAYQGLTELPDQLYKLEHLTKLVIGECCLALQPLTSHSLSSHSPCVYPYGLFFPTAYCCVAISACPLSHSCTDIDSVLTPPREITSISLEAEKSFFRDCEEDGRAHFLHYNVSDFKSWAVVQLGICCCHAVPASRCLFQSSC